MTDFESQVAALVQDGLSVSEIEQRLKISNRNVRRIKQRLYAAGTLQPTGVRPMKRHIYGNPR